MRHARVIVFTALAVLELLGAGPLAALDYSAPEKFLLKNGLKLIVKTDHSIPRIGLALVVAAGPAEERAGEVGASRVAAGIWSDVEGVPELQALAHKLEANGAYWGAQTEGSFLVGMAEFPSDLTADGLELASQWLSLRRPADGVLAKVRDVIVREVGYRKDNPRNQGVVRDQLLARMYGDIPAARALASGTAEYARLDAAAVESFASRCLSPSRASLVVVGDVDAPKLLEAVQKAFQQPATPEAPASAARPAPAGAPEPETTYGAVDTGVAALGFRAPGPRDPDYPAIVLLARWLAGGPGSVLARRLVDREVQLKEVSAEVTFQPTENLLMFELVSTTDDAEPAGRAVLEECARLGRHPPDAAALAALRAGTKAVRALRRQKLVEQAVAFGIAEQSDDVDLEVDFNGRLDQVTSEDLRRAAAKWLAPRLATFSQMRPRRAQGKTAQCVCYRDMPDGVGVNLRRDPSSEVVGLSLYVPGAFYLEPPEQAGISNLLEEMLAQGATAVEPRDQTVDRLGRHGAVLSRLKLLLSNPVGKDALVLSLNATLYSFDELLKTLRDIVYQPAFDEASFRHARERQIDFWKDMVENPEDNGQWEITNRLYPGIYARPAAQALAAVQKLTIDDLKAYHTKITSLRRAVIGVCGNLTEQRVMERVRAVFPAPAGEAGKEPPAPAFEPLTAVKIDVIPGKKAYDTVWVGLKIGPEPGIKDVALSTVWWTLLGFSTDALFPKLAQAIDPGARMVTCTYSPRRFGSEMVFGFRVKAGAGRKVAAAFEAEVAKLKAMQVTPQQIELTRRKIVSLVTMQFQDKVGQSAKMGFAKFVKDQPDLYEGTLDAYKSVKLEELSAMAQTFFGGAQIVVYEGKE